jgi:hypothetical protein
MMRIKNVLMRFSNNDNVQILLLKFALNVRSTKCKLGLRESLKFAYAQPSINKYLDNLHVRNVPLIAMVSNQVGSHLSTSFQK